LKEEVAAGGDGKEGQLGQMSVYFIHLADRTSFNVGSDKVFYVWPLVVGLY